MVANCQSCCTALSGRKGKASSVMAPNGEEQQRKNWGPNYTLFGVSCRDNIYIYIYIYIKRGSTSIGFSKEV